MRNKQNKKMNKSTNIQVKPKMNNYPVSKNLYQRPSTQHLLMGQDASEGEVLPVAEIDVFCKIIPANPRVVTASFDCVVDCLFVVEEKGFLCEKRKPDEIIFRIFFVFSRFLFFYFYYYCFLCWLIFIFALFLVLFV